MEDRDSQLRGDAVFARRSGERLISVTINGSYTQHVSRYNALGQRARRYDGSTGIWYELVNGPRRRRP